MMTVGIGSSLDCNGCRTTAVVGVSLIGRYWRRRIDATVDMATALATGEREQRLARVGLPVVAGSLTEHCDATSTAFTVYRLHRPIDDSCSSIHEYAHPWICGSHNNPPASSVMDFIFRRSDGSHVSVDTVHLSLLLSSSFSSPMWYTISRVVLPTYYWSRLLTYPTDPSLAFLHLWYSLPSVSPIFFNVIIVRITMLVNKILLLC